MFVFSFLKDLKLKDEQCKRLSKVRDQLGQELEELTASLFEVGPTG